MAQRDKVKESLSISEDQSKDFFIKGLNEESVNSITEIFSKLSKGEENRHYAQTNMNHSSSRSHSIFKINIKSITNNFINKLRNNSKEKVINNFCNESEDKLNSNTIVYEAFLNFVDLAGSERISSHFEDYSK